MRKDDEVMPVSNKTMNRSFQGVSSRDLKQFLESAITISEGRGFW